MAAVSKIEENAFPKIFIQLTGISRRRIRIHRRIESRAFDNLDVKFPYSETCRLIFSDSWFDRCSHLWDVRWLAALHGFLPQNFSLRKQEAILRHDDRPSVRCKSRTEPRVRLLRRDVSRGSLHRFAVKLWTAMKWNLLWLFEQNCLLCT